MPMRKTPHTLTDQLRRIVRESGRTLGELSQETGIHKSALSRFLTGERGVSVSALDTLGEYFGLSFTVKPGKSKVKKGR